MTPFELNLGWNTKSSLDCFLGSAVVTVESLAVNYVLENVVDWKCVWMLSKISLFGVVKYNTARK